jgi:hypothetical protein
MGGGGAQALKGMSYVTRKGVSRAMEALDPVRRRWVRRVAVRLYFFILWVLLFAHTYFGIPTVLSWSPMVVICGCGRTNWRVHPTVPWTTPTLHSTPTTPHHSPNVSCSFATYIAHINTPTARPRILACLPSWFCSGSACGWQCPVNTAVTEGVVPEPAQMDG